MTIANLEKSPYEIERDKPMPSRQHARVQTRMIGLFYSLYSDQIEVFSELTLRFKDKNYTPDLCLFKAGALSEIGDEIQVEQAPLCVVEILSPSQVLQQLLDKAKVYFENGVQSYWLAMPALRNIYVYENLQKYEIYKETDLLKDTVLNIEIDLNKVFLG